MTTRWRRPSLGDASAIYDGRAASFRPLPPTPDDPRGSVGRLEFLYPWIYAPLSSFPISLYGTVASVASGATADVITLAARFRGSLTRLTALGFGDAGTYTPPSNKTWTVLISGVPTQPITAIPFQFGTITVPSPLPGVGIIIPSGEDFILRFANNTVGAVLRVEARLDGYTWSEPV